MMTREDRIRRAITDARALLDTLRTSHWQDIHVVSGETGIFIARPGGRANPMLAVPQSEIASAPQAPVTPETSVIAQYVATLVDVLPVGATVQVGQKVATLRILDEEAVVLAPVAGRVVATPADSGALIEYGMTILSIAEAA